MWLLETTVAAEAAWCFHLIKPLQREKEGDLRAVSFGVRHMVAITNAVHQGTALYIGWRWGALD